ncbi:Putative AphA-like transcriptional regulator [Tistlia consotensis]|uniref:Putative AphA-like transcriptional regulator n=1 Tax=Tistlia consotensis USBA 355 TaxID=560819 RepID=A0A1Y6CF00_9PROT|nr:hypothetical protein [Tistlia consotensis]SMF60870.1 Putative AphA-like transcriptional regulator [Tistlia consotensis USBA 355]SNR92573.1 Putative AphA-like transcriptional regulator [Tistlia consotensis]
MYRDNSLMPSEAVRLLALGLLATRARNYGALASEVRHFIGHLVGPSLELVAQPLELLKVEGLCKPQDSQLAAEEQELRITRTGEQELHRLLASNVRAQVNDLSKLIVAIKIRFLHLLPEAEREAQVEMLLELFERELLRLIELRHEHEDGASELAGWLDLEIAQTRARLAWFDELRGRIGGTGSEA